MTTTERGRDRIDWPPIIERAAKIVREYDTAVSLRQVFYRLVAEGLIPNTMGSYKTLSDRTAKARRAGLFPTLSDQGREVRHPLSYASPEAALRQVRAIYRRDRTEGQDCAIYLGIEKATLSAQVWSWFSERGLPMVALRGYASQSLADEVARDVEWDGRPAVLLYAGDHDPSGDDLLRDFLKRSNCWSEVVRVALTAAQVESYALPVAPGKPSDTRASQFIKDHGRLVQVEVEALDPAVLRALFTTAVDRFWDPSAARAVLEREAADLLVLRERT